MRVPAPFAPATLALPALLALLAVTALLPPPAGACTALIAGRGTTADGSLLFAKTEDNSERDVDFLWLIPRRRHAAGATVVLKGGGVVPQVGETYSFLWDQIPGADYSSAVVNEWGVAIGSNACPSREDPPEVVAARGDLVDGGIGFDLRLILVERARTAREAVEMAADLLDRYGYAASGRTLNIVDPREAWQLQMVCGKQYVARRVRDDEVAILANTYSIRGVDPDDHENFVCSPRLIEYAVERGWYDPARGPFDFAAAYASPQSHVDPRNTDRQWNLARLLRVDFPLTYRQARTGVMPVSVHPDHKLTVPDVMRVLRDHYEATELDSTRVKGVGPHRSHRVACWATTNLVTIVQQRADLPPAIGTVIWRALEAPCGSGFVPWYLGIDRVPAAFHLAPVRADTARGQRADFHFSLPPETWRLGLESSSELFKLLVDLIDGDRAAAMPPARRAWDEFEARELALQPAVEDTALRLWQEDEAKARAYLTRTTTRQAVRSLAVARGLIETLPRTPGTWTAQGRHMLAQEKFEAAVEAFEQALKLDPSWRPAQEGLAAARQRSAG